MKTGARICIGGYAGCGNLGDDALLTGFLRGIWQNGFVPSRVTVLSGRPRRDRRRFGVRCAGRKNPFAVAAALWRSDWFVLGGGTLLQNRSGTRSLLYYCLLLRLARLFRCRCVCLGGLGPLKGKFATRIAKNSLKCCRFFLLRDRESAKLARRLGVPEENLRVGADSAFLLPAPPPLRLAWVRRRLTGNLQTPYVCVCPGKGESTAALAAWLRAMRAFPVYLLCDVRDAPAAKTLQKEFGGVLYAPQNASDAMAALAGAELVLSCRLHPLILSVRLGVRCVCFSGGDPKLSAFCRAAQLPLFPAKDADVPAPEALFRLPPPKSGSFCKTAAKDLAFFCKMVYNGGNSPPANPRGGKEADHEKRATGGFAPPRKL